jgi:hypothetical protein
MANAYRYAAAPLALASGSCALVWNIFRGVKDAVSARMLAERADADRQG